MKKEILVTSNVNPDLDGFACVFAYAYFLNQTGIKAIPSISGKHHEEADHVLSEYSLNLDIKEENPQEYNQIVIVDASGSECLDKRTDPDNVIEIIDHRKINMSEQFANAKVQIELVGAVATLVAEKYKENAVLMPKDIATLVYGAIISNTLNFQAKVNTDRDREIAVWLKKENNFPNDFAHKMFLSKSDLSGGKLIQILQEDFVGFAGHNFGSYRLGTAQIEMIGGKEIALARKTEIIAELKKIMADQNLNFVFLTIIDLEANQNIIVVPTKEIEKILSKVLNISFIHQIAVRPGLIMRKEIVPLLKEEFINLSQKEENHD